MLSVDCGFANNGGSSGSANLEYFGPTLPVQIGFDPAYNSGSGLAPQIPQNLLPALVDTGAAVSCIDSNLAMLLNLPIVDRQLCSGIGGSEHLNMHLAQIYVPQLDFTIYGRFAGVHLTAGNQLHQALIGRTFLRNCTLQYDGTSGAVTITLASTQ